ncbi:hypothetical protein [uncultured Tessaracoccus sp.]|uniref:hypothetical protein n=1 Tax=uncultured Tessaracoccus sp. TaxID=905023 RepID=UPI0025D1CA26|nr:hypothetical protein [uncultured Tessaracoccus sp.]
MTTLPTSIDEAWSAYRAAPSSATVLAAQQALAGACGFTRALTWLPAVEIYLDKGRFDDAARVLTERLPVGLLCPVVHAYLARAHEALGEHERARAEEQLAWQSLSAIQATGDGSAERPWHVLYVDDVHAVLASRGLRPRRQRATEDRDLIACSDGNTYAFDYARVP